MLVPALSVSSVTAWMKGAETAVGHVVMLDNCVVLRDKINLLIRDASSGNTVI